MWAEPLSALWQRLLGRHAFADFYGQGIKEPRFDQTYGTDVCDPGNPDLKPESSKNWSAGLDQKLSGDRFKVSANYFYYRFYNIVSFGQATGPPGCPFFGSYFNTDLAFSRGVNMPGRTARDKVAVCGGELYLRRYAGSKSPNASDPALIAGNRLIRRPLNSGSITLTAAIAGSMRYLRAILRECEPIAISCFLASRAIPVMRDSISPPAIRFIVGFHLCPRH